MIERNALDVYLYWLAIDEGRAVRERELKAVLAEHADGTELTIDREPRRKPRLRRVAGSADIRFSVSRSGTLACVAVTLGADVGVDVDVEPIVAIPEARCLPRTEHDPALGVALCAGVREAVGSLRTPGRRLVARG